MPATTIDPARLREAGRAALAELTVKQEVIGELQALIDEKWREAYSIEARVKAVLVGLGVMSADDPFDESTAARALGEAS